MNGRDALKVGIVGYGFVGKHLERELVRSGFKVAIFDKYSEGYSTESHRGSIQDCIGVFVAVPTNQKSNGEIDLTEVEDATSWIKPPICIKSTVIPGTTDRLIQKTGKHIVFSPEYIGETPFHRYGDGRTVDLVVIGGARNSSMVFGEIYKQMSGPDVRYFFPDAVTAELAKYMENCYLAMKVAFVAQFHQLAEDFGADFEVTREIWVADPRVGRSHSLVVNGLGFAGRCLPKDLSAIIRAASCLRGAPLLEALQAYNNNLRSVD